MKNIKGKIYLSRLNSLNDYERYIESNNLTALKAMSIEENIRGKMLCLDILNNIGIV